MQTMERAQSTESLSAPLRQLDTEEKAAEEIFGQDKDSRADADLTEESPLKAHKYRKVGPMTEEARIIGESDWRQMRFKAHVLKYDDHWVSGLFVLIGLTFIPLGIWAFLLSLSVSEQRFTPYSQDSRCQISSDADFGKVCTTQYQLNADFTPPIYVYYHLDQIFQNHRAYVKNRQESQLRGETPLRIRDCRLDQATDSENKKEWYSNYVPRDAGDPKRFQIGKPIYPCGLIANSFFNDRILMSYCTPTLDKGRRCKKMCSHGRCMDTPQHRQWSDVPLHSFPNWDNAGIAWPSDIPRKFGAYVNTSGETTNQNYLQRRQNLTLPRTQDEDFVVWMRIAVSRSFSKLHRVIRQQSFKKGNEIELKVQNFFQIPTNGKKSVVISTMSVLGGRNPFLGISFMMTGGVSMVMFLVFFLSAHNEENPIDKDPNHQSIVDDQSFMRHTIGGQGDVGRGATTPGGTYAAEPSYTDRDYSQTAKTILSASSRQ